MCLIKKHIKKDAQCALDIAMLEIEDEIKRQKFSKHRKMSWTPEGAETIARMIIDSSEEELRELFFGGVARKIAKNKRATFRITVFEKIKQEILGGETGLSSQSPG